MASPLRQPCSCLARGILRPATEGARPGRRRLAATHARRQHTDASARPSPPPSADRPEPSTPATASSPRFEPVASTSAEPYVPLPREETPITGLLYATTLEELQDYRIVSPGDEVITEFFARHLSPLAFDTVVATRTMTHPLAAGPHGNHNGKLASLGRHVLRANLAAFINAHRDLLPDDIEIDAGWMTEVLSPTRLANGPGEALGVAAAMRYRETLGVIGTVFPRLAHRGQMVEALNGAVYKQHGGLTALRFFHSRILPHLAYPREWADAVRQAATEDHDLAGQGSYLLDRGRQRGKRTLEVVSS